MLHKDYKDDMISCKDYMLIKR